jgi:hypothetical protein
MKAGCAIDMKTSGQTGRTAIEAALKATKKPARDPRWERLPGKRGRGRG